MLRNAALVLLLGGISGISVARAEEALAPVEARVPFAPAAFTGSDGRTHLAYELHVTNFYGDSGTLAPQGLDVFGDDAATPLLALDAKQLAQMVKPAPAARMASLYPAQCPGLDDRYGLPGRLGAAGRCAAGAADLDRLGDGITEKF